VKCLGVKRFKQDLYGGYCAVAASAVVANYFNKEINYEIAKDILYSSFGIKPSIHFPGLTRGKIGSLLNHLGFNRVDIYIAELDQLGWSTERGKSSVVDRLKKVSRGQNKAYKSECKDLSDFLLLKNKNSITVDCRLGDRIREAIDDNIPVVASFNWSLFFGVPCRKDNEWEEHAVVIDGYDKNYVRIIDSHSEQYKYRLKKYSQGRYKIRWEDLMTICSPGGDIIIPRDYKGLK